MCDFGLYFLAFTEEGFFGELEDGVVSDYLDDTGCHEWRVVMCMLRGGLLFKYGILVIQDESSIEKKSY